MVTSPKSNVSAMHQSKGGGAGTDGCYFSNCFVFCAPQCVATRNVMVWDETSCRVGGFGFLELLFCLNCINPNGWLG